ncbi:50S ribosomal protein L25 [bacterium]|nr:50S ribosomal protein L25 [bacterium]
MSTEVQLSVDLRSARGSKQNRRLRDQGFVPGNIYGHMDEPQAIMVKAEAIAPHVKAGVKVYDVTLDGKTSKTLLRELQFDALGIELTHFDLLRVDPTERVTLHVPVILKGIAPGSAGVLEQPLHSLHIDCLAYQIPDSIPVRINMLEIGQAIHVRDLELPEGMHAHHPPEAIVVHVVPVRSGDSAPADVAAGAQPEVVGKKTEDASKDK